MTDICEIAEKLAEKNSYVRKEAKKMMKKWEDISYCGEKLISDTSCAYTNDGANDVQFYLHTAESELKNWHCGEYNDIAELSHFTEVLPMPILRLFLNDFPKMVQEIQQKIERKLIKNTKVIEILDKVNESN